MLYADDTLYQPEAFQAAVDGLAGERVVLSNELFVGQSVNFNYVNRSQVARRLHQAMPEATVLLCIRGQAELLKSLYSIALHGDEQRSLEEFIWNGAVDQHREHATTAGAAPSYFNTSGGYEQLDGYLYQPLIDLYRSLFPKVVVLVYEDLIHAPERYIQSLEEAVGVSINDDVKAEILAGKKVHKGVGLEQAQRLRKLNRYYDAAHRSTNKQRIYNYRKRKILSGESSTKLQFSAATQAVLRDFYGPANEALNKAIPTLQLERYAEYYLMKN